MSASEIDVAVEGRPDAKEPRPGRPAPDRYRNPIGKYKIARLGSCLSCGRCVEACPEGVHVKPAGYAFTLRPRDHLCIGPECARTDHFCVDLCPQEALSMRPNPTVECLGDARWSSDLILSTWHQAATGKRPPPHLEHRHGNSGGGFDSLRFQFEIDGSVAAGRGRSPREIHIGLDLNQRDDGRPRLHIDLPIFGGGMSFGSVSVQTVLAKAMAAAAWNTFTFTGEGGYPDRLKPYGDHVIAQIATGLSGVGEETIRHARIVELEHAQGGRPDLGERLRGSGSSPPAARGREVVPGRDLSSPFASHGVHGPEDREKQIDWIKEVNPDCLVSVKVSPARDVDRIAIGSFQAGAHIIHLDGGNGGTGAAPEIAEKKIAMPIEFAIPKVHKALRAEGIRDAVTLIASGGIRTPHDLLQAVALGADGVAIGAAELVALGCVRCECCERGRGCPRGIASTDPALTQQMNLEWATQRLVNLYGAWREQIVEVLALLGMRSIRELRGRVDLLCLLSEEPGVGGEVHA